MESDRIGTKRKSKQSLPRAEALLTTLRLESELADDEVDGSTEDLWAALNTACGPTRNSRNASAAVGSPSSPAPAPPGGGAGDTASFPAPFRELRLWSAAPNARRPCRLFVLIYRLCV